MDTLPHELINKIAGHSSKSAPLILTHVNKQLRAQMLNYIRTMSYKCAMFEAARLNSLELVQYLMGLNAHIFPQICAEFTKHNNATAARFLLENGATIDNNVIHTAIKYGGICILDLAAELNIPINGWNHISYIDQVYTDMSPVIDWFVAHNIDTEFLASAIASTGNLELYKLVENKYKPCARIALIHGHFHLIKYMRIQQNDFVGLCTILPEKYDHNGIVKSIKYIHEKINYSPFGFLKLIIAIGDVDFLKERITCVEDHMSTMTGAGSIEMVEYLLSRGIAPSSDVFVFALERNNIPLIKYCIDKGFPISLFTLCIACRYDIGIIKLMYAATNNIVNNDYEEIFPPLNNFDFDSSIIIEKLEYLHSASGRDSRLLESACERGNIEVIKWLLNYGYKFNDEYPTAIANNHSDVIYYLHRRPDIDLNYGKIFKAAIKYGNIELIKFAHEYIVPVAGAELIEKYIAYPCYIAAKHGQLSALKLLRDLGYVWNHTVSEIALIYGKSKILEYLIDNDCPMPDSGYIKSLNYDGQTKSVLTSHKLLFFISSRCSPIYLNFITKNYKNYGYFALRYH